MGGEVSFRVRENLIRFAENNNNVLAGSGQLAPLMGTLTSVPLQMCPGY